MAFSKISRRRFIQGVSGVSVASLFPAFNPAHAVSASGRLAKAIGQPFPRGVTLPEKLSPKADKDSIGVALVGLGYYALAKMAPAFNFSKHCHIAGLVSGNPSKATRVAKAYGVPSDAIYDYENFASIANDDRIDVIYIVLPSGLHAEWTEKAFAAGKHVLCEKPMALSADECTRMINASQRANRKLMIGYRCHFEPNNLQAMQLMRDQAIGKIQVIRTDHHYVIGNASPDRSWRVNGALAGGGALEDYGIYGLQAALYLTGELPISVSAVATKPANHPAFTEIRNLVASRFTFPSGAIAQLSTSYNASWNDRIEVRGDKGIMLMNPATGYQGHRITFSQAANNNTISEDPSMQFSLMLDHFGEAIKTDSPILTDGEMGRRDVRLIEAIYASADSGRRISLNPNGTMLG
jgi:predicted dehydrogenase